MIKTYQFRIKDSNKVNQLLSLSRKVNFVWNYINETSQFAWKRDRKWLSEFDFNYLMIGASRELGLHARSLESISRQFVTNRNKAKRCKLRWRSSKNSLGWVPFRGRSIKIVNDSFVFQKETYRFWKSREIEGKVKSGSITQNTKGQWFVSFQCEVETKANTKSKKAIGIDLGLKTLATLSTGDKIENPKILNKWAEKLAKAQRANKKRQVSCIQTKVKNIRKDYLHKESTKLVNKFGTIFVGDVSSSKLAKTKMAKSVLDAGWGTFKSMLAYKAITLGVDFKVIDERYSSVTCSDCFERSGPSGLSALGVREWQCIECKTIHDRDTNAAINILRLGRETQLVESPGLPRGGRQQLKGFI